MNHKEKRRNLWLSIAIAAVTVIVAIVDFNTPRGMAAGTLYVVPTVLSLWLPQRRSTLIVGSVGILSVIIGFFASPPSQIPIIFVLINRGLSLVAITTLIIIGMRPRAAEYLALMLQKRHAEELLKEIEARAFRNLRLVAQLKWGARTAAIVVMVIGSVVLFGGWVFGNPGLQSLVPGFPKMMPNTALGLLLLAVSLFLHNSTLQERWRAGWIGRFLAVAVAGLGIVTIAEYLLGINLGIDELLFRDSSPGATYPGRPSPQTSLAFALAGASLLLQGEKRLWVLWTGQLLGLIVGFIAIVAMVGYMYASVPLYGVTPYTGMAVHTVFSLLMLSLGIVFAKPDRGLVTIFSSDSAGGMLMRRLLPAIIVIPVVLSILSGWGERKGLYSANFGIVLHDALYVAVQAVLLWFFASTLQRAEASRRQMNEALESSFVQIEASNRALEQTQAELRRLNEQLEQRVKERTAALANNNEKLELEITERKRTEEVLQESEEKYRDLVTRINDGIFTFDTQGVITFANRACADICGSESPEEIMGRNFLQFVVPAQKDEIADAFRQYAKTGNPLENQEVSIIRKDGSIAFIQMRPVLVIKGGLIKGYSGVVRDITEQRQIQEHMMAQERLASIGQLVSGIAHELNNPLTGVIGFSELLLEKDVPQDVKADLIIINKEAKRTANVVKGLLTFARKQKTEKEPVDINGIIQEVLQLRAYEQRVSNVEVVTQFADALPRVLGNRAQLQQVLINIIINAEQAMLEAHGRGKLTIATELKGNIVRTSVSDDGPGISPENMKKLFTPFFTTKEVGKGTGLGLSICHGIITEHGGKIYAESEFGKGATFIIGLPIGGNE